MASTTSVRNGLRIFLFGIVLTNSYALLVFPRNDTRNSRNDTWKLDLSDCGTKKGCWFMPGDCKAGNNGSHVNCDSIFTWRLEQKSGGKRNLIFEFDTRTDDMENKYLGKYASIGFSDDYKMGNDYVVECVANPSGQIRAFLSFNDMVMNIRSKKASEILLSKTKGSFHDNRLSCQTVYAVDDISNPDIPDDEKWRIVDITNRPFYFLFARGDSDVETNALQMHSLMDDQKFPWIVTERMDVTKDKKQLTSAKHYDIPRSIQYQLVQAHGIMMLFGWWVFAATAMLLSRYFKPLWPDATLCGQAPWFQLHRALMIISLILQCSAFALIFIQAGTLFTCSHVCNDHSYALMLHTYLGISCTAAALIQPFMALCRPSPASSKRPIFNWLHWFFGTGGFILATVTIFLSAMLGKAGLRWTYEYTPDYIMAGFVVAFIVCSLAFEMLWYCRFRSESSNHIQLTTAGPRVPPSSKSLLVGGRSVTNIQVAILAFFFTAAAALCSALAYLITSAH